MNGRIFLEGKEHRPTFRLHITLSSLRRGPLSRIEWLAQKGRLAGRHPMRREELWVREQKLLERNVRMQIQG